MRMEQPKMPLVKYFAYVGAALLALIFVVGKAFPTPPADQVASAAVAASDTPMIRIRTDRKWPERVEFDTSAPTIVPVPVQTASAAAPASVQSNATSRDAFAQLTPPDVKKPDPKPPQKRKVAKRRVAPPPMQVAQRPQFGFFGNTIWQ
jgi:hypothetical protein